MSAFAGWPKVVAPKGGKRIFQLRTYESASYAGHFLKVQMFNEAEIGIFTRTGLTPVFFGDTLIGSRMPSLTYMLTFADVADLNAKWNVFVNDPGVERALAAAAVRGCGDCEQYFQSVFKSAGLFADLGEDFLRVTYLAEKSPPKRSLDEAPSRVDE